MENLGEIGTRLYINNIGSKAQVALKKGLQNIGILTDQTRRCPVILLLDNSGSMYGDPIDELNDGIITFKQAISKDRTAAVSVEVAIITFGDEVELVQDFTTVNQFNPPNLDADGLTPMGEAINTALSLLESRKQTYKTNGIEYYRPWIWLITDGEPTDTTSWPISRISKQVREGDNQGKFLFFAVGVGNDVNMQILSQIAPPKRPPLLLNGLDFQGMFDWLSSSVIEVSHSQPGQATSLNPPPITWGQVSIF